MNVPTEPSRLDLRIEGMHCGACVAAVEKALRSAPGVIDATVNLATESAAVTWDRPSRKPGPLLEAIRAAGYDAVLAKKPTAELQTTLDTQRADRFREHRQALIIAVGMGLPVIVLHQLAGRLVSTQPGSHLWPTVVEGLLLLLLLCSPAAGPILVGGLRSALRGSANMDLLVGLGVSVAFLGSVVAPFLPRADDAAPNPTHFHTAAMILIFINLGRYLEARARGRASQAIAALAARAPQTATRLIKGQTETVPVDQLSLGDLVRVGPDTHVPIDGTITEGAASVDESMLTGESVPADRQSGDRVFGGTRVCSGLITVRATATGSDSAIARILQAVQRAQSGRTRMQSIADRVAAVFVPAVVAAAALTWIAWLVAGADNAPQRGFLAAVAVLVVACPCAMGLAIPVAVLVATGNAALRGILVRDAAALEAAGNVTVVALDKTGTLTTGRMKVTHVLDEPVATVTHDDRELLTIAAAAEQHSQHPLARAIVGKAREWGVTLGEPDELESLAGLGVRARFGTEEVLVGSARMMADRKIDLEPVRAQAEKRVGDGQTVVFVTRNARVAGTIALADTLRPEAAHAISDLSRLGIQTILLTGDHRRVAAATASQAGIHSVHAELTPQGKAEHVRALQEGDARVAVVGDGINDAPALASAEVGISFGSGTDVARETAGICLISDNLALVPQAISLGRRSVRIIRQNLFWAFAYNALAVPVAALGWLRPEMAAGAMMLSSISVVLNSLRLREPG